MTGDKPLRQHTTAQALSPEIAHGDERERATFTEGGTYGMYTGIYLCFLTALAFALFGHILVPFILVVLGAVPAGTAYGYAQKRGVDTFAILARSSRKPALANVSILVILLLMSAAMVFTTTAGSGVLEFELPQTWTDRLGSAAQGAAIGAGVGAMLGYLAAAWVVRRRRKQLQNEPDDDEE